MDRLMDRETTLCAMSKVPKSLASKQHDRHSSKTLDFACAPRTQNQGF